jgi:hypothetical protein
MTNKRFVFYLTLIVITGIPLFLWLYLLRYERFIRGGPVAPLEMVWRALPFCGLAQSAVYVLSWLNFHLLLLALGKNLKERQVPIARFGTLGFALLIETAFLIQVRNMGPGFLVDIAYTIPPLAFAIFLVVLSAAKLSGLARFDKSGKR